MLRNASDRLISEEKKVQRTIGQVTDREAVLDTVAGLSVPPTLQAGILLLGRLQHAVAAQTLRGGADLFKLLSAHVRC